MEALRQRKEELKRLCEKYPVSIPVKEAAQFLGMKPENLRCAIALGGVKGAIWWQKPGSKNSAYSIQTLPFYEAYGGNSNV